MIMDQTRLFIAILLSFLLFFLWEFFFVDKEKLNQPKIELSNQQIAKVTPILKDELIDNKQPGSEDVALLSKKHRKITINTPLYSVQISEKGAVFTSFILKKYRQHIELNSPLLEMLSTEPSAETITLAFQNKTSHDFDLNNSFFLSKLPSDSIDIYENPEEVSFTFVSSSGIVIEKKFTFFPETYLIKLNVAVKNQSDQTFQNNLIVSIQNKGPADKTMYGFEGPSALINDKLTQIKTKKIETTGPLSGKIKWIALQDRYFISCIIPEKPAEAVMQIGVNPQNILKADYIQPESIIAPNTQHVFEYSLYFGPKSMKALAKANYDLKKAVNFGMFDVIAKPCVWAMNYLYEFIPNYGIAIIMLTVFIKIILWPLGSKSYKSMSEMKKLQPLMAELREKHKNNKQKMNQEIMGLYKTYKVNPLGGCLPMVVQIPIFFALYRMLYEAIELRHAPFFGWINDLAAPDRLFNFDFSIPFMQPPYGIPVLTIIMGGTMFLQQKMSPPMGDPSQAKIMMFMPIIFTVIFINFSSGLVLYWLVNNILSISQQYYIQKKYA
jgi:YidC/Oxa1 family membrane protein insertase